MPDLFISYKVKIQNYRKNPSRPEWSGAFVLEPSSC
jgi:hypothetical protein